MPRSCTAFFTLPMSRSNANSGACTPITTGPVRRVLACPGGRVRQRAQAVDARIRPEIDQHDLAAQAGRRQRRRVEPLHRAVERRQRAFDGQRGSRMRRIHRAHHRAAGDRPAVGLGAIGCRGHHRAAVRVAGGVAGRGHRRRCARCAIRTPAEPVDELRLGPPVVTVDSCASAPVSRPSAIAPTPASSATPIPRLIHSPAPSERFIAANTLPPITSATPSDVAAPAAYATSSSVVPTLAPRSAAPVSTRPRIGRARRPQQAGRDAEQQRRRGAGRAAVALREAGEPVAGGDERARQVFREARHQQGQAEDREQHDRDPAAGLVGLRDPAAADGRERRDDGKRERHADEQRQAAADERLVGAREHEREHGQDARARIVSTPPR